jgi:uncharacterized membrane protein YgcG
MTYRTVTFLCTILLLSACGQDNQPAPQLFKDQRDVLDKAKTIDAAQQKQDEEQRKVVEKQTQ